jgi:ATP-binding cassette subfamily F protein 3
MFRGEIMSLLRVNQLSKAFSGNALFNNISFDVNPKEKVALIGRNGTGKSTLFKIILNELPADQGDVFIHGQTRIGYLSQNIIEDENHTLYQEVITVFNQVIELEKKIASIAKEMENNHSEKLLNQYARLEDEFQQLGGYHYIVKVNTLLSHFGFEKKDYKRVVKTFSGGEKTRIAFAKLLMIEPDLLLLDEPTNHMDIEIIEWLEDYLKSYNGAVFIITHDKYFINKVCQKIIEIDQESLEIYHGNYDDYEEEKYKRYELKLKRYLKQQKEIEHLQSFVDRFRYKASKASSAQDRIKKLERIDKIDKPSLSKAKVHIQFKTKRPTKIYIIELKDLAIGYDKSILSSINFKMRGFDKLGIIGPNGSGKTTLIKTIMSHIQPLEGQVVFNKRLKIGYFDQNLDRFDKRLTLLETIHQVYPAKTLTEVRNDLARVMFVQEDAYKHVSMLSGGELVKLNLLFLMLEEPDLLILDEPTNHLDIDTKSIIEDVFEAYDGPIIFISHDRYFINKVATKIMSIKDKVEVYNGNYTDYIGEIKKEEKIKEKIVHKKEKTIDIDKFLLEIEESISKKEIDIEKQRNILFKEDIYMDKDKYKQENDKLQKMEKDLEDLYHEMDEVMKKEY